MQEQLEEIQEELRKIDRDLRYTQKRMFDVRVKFSVLQAPRVPTTDAPGVIGRTVQQKGCSMNLQELIDKYLKDAEFDPRETEWLATPKDFAEAELSRFAKWCAAQQGVQRTCFNCGGPVVGE